MGWPCTCSDLQRYIIAELGRIASAASLIRPYDPRTLETHVRAQPVSLRFLCSEMPYPACASQSPDGRAQAPWISLICHTSSSTSLPLRAAISSLGLVHITTRRCPTIDDSYRTATCCSGQHLSFFRRSGWGLVEVRRKGWRQC